MSDIRITIIVLFITHFINAHNTCAAVFHVREAENSASLSGTVADLQTKLGVEYANVILYAPDSVIVNGTITGKNGEFTLNQVSKGKYYLVIQFIGYEKTLIDSLEITGNKEHIDLGVIYLKQSNYQLQGVEVITDKHTLDYTLDKQVINVSAMATAANGTAIDVLRQSPSVTVDVNEVVFLRGSAGFLLLINNIPATGNTTDVLRQIPAHTIEKIEIITNPSSKYDSQGTSGIVNIITNRHSEKTSAALIGVRGNTSGQAGLDVNLKYERKKFSTNVSAGYQYHPVNMSIVAERNVISDSNVFNYNSYAQIKRRVQNPFVRIQSQWQVSTQTEAGISLNSSFFKLNRDIQTTYLETVQNEFSNVYSKSNDYFLLRGMMTDVTGFVQHQFDTSSHYIDIRMNMGFWDGMNDENINRFSTDELWTSSEFVSGSRYREENWIKNLTINIDYVREKGPAKIEGGVQYFNRPSECEYTTLYKDISKEGWNIDNYFSGFHKHEVQRFTVYGLAGINKEKWGVQAGIRVEDYNSKLDLPQRNETYSSSGLFLYPSFHVQYGQRGKTQYQMSYSRRVNYPNDWQLSPTPFLNDGYLIQIGNPGLDPEFIDLYEVNRITYLKNKHMLSTSLYVRSVSNNIIRSTNVMDNGKIMMTFENFEKSSYFGAEAAIHLMPSNNIGLNISGNIYRQTGKSKVNKDVVSFTNNSFSVNSELNIRMKQGFRFQITAIYNGPEYEGQSLRKSMWMINTAVRKDIFHGKCSTNLQFNDVLHTMKFRSEINNPALQSETVWSQQYPVLSLGITYKINDYKQPETNMQQKNTPTIQGI